MRLPSVILPLQVFVVVVRTQSSGTIIRDYFMYKNVTRVVGFSCGDTADDFLTIRLLNDAGISAAITPAGFPVDVPRYLDTYRTLGVFLDIRCSNHNASSIFDESTAHRMFDYSYNWLILGTNLSHSAQSLNDSGFSIVTDFVILLPDESDYVLYDVYNHCRMRGGTLNITRLGTWRQDGGFTITLIGSKIVRRRNYHQMRVKEAGIVLHRPENVTLVDYLEGDTTEIMDGWPKFGHTILSHLSNIFNFTLDPIEITHWEKNDSNGPVIGALKRDSADLAYYPSILTIPRYSDARVILQQWPTRTCFMFRTIPATKMKPWVILKPFAANTWYVIFAMVVMIVLSLSFIMRLEHVEEYDGCSISALIAVAALSQQGFPSLTDHSASRIAFIQIMVFGLLVYNYYSAAIVSARLNEPLQKMNDSLYSLMHSKMILAAEENIFFDFLLRNTRQEVQYFKRFWNAIPESKRFLSIEEGVKRMMIGGFAYHADPDDIYPTIEQEFDKQMICQLTEVHLLPPSELGLWSNLKSHFHEIAKIGLIKISTSGLRRREIHRRAARRPYCPTELFVSSVTIYETAPILILLLIGMTISLILFGIEKLVFYVMHPKRVTAGPPVPRKRNRMLLTDKEPSFFKNHNVIHDTLPKIIQDIQHRQIKYWSSKKCQLDTLSTRSLFIQKTAPALILLVFGMIVASGICVVENIVYRRSARKRMSGRSRSSEEED